MAWLFARCADAWAHASARRQAWRNLAVYGVGGSTLRVADSPEDRDFFAGANRVRGTSGYPQLRLVAPMALRSHLQAQVAFGPYGTGGVTYAEELCSSVADDAVCIVDRGFFATQTTEPVLSPGREAQDGQLPAQSSLTVGRFP